MITVDENHTLPDGAILELTIDKYPKGNPKSRTNIHQYKTPSFTGKHLFTYSHKDSFSCEVPYTLNSFSDSANLIEFEKDILIRELEEVFKIYTNSFKNNDLTLYKELTRERQENMFTSMYVNTEEQKRYESSYLAGVDQEGISFYPIENYQLVFYGNGRLVGLQKPREAPGVFIDNEDESQSFIEYILLHKKNKKTSLTVIL